MKFEEALKNEKIRNVMVPHGIEVSRSASFGQVIEQLQQEAKFCAVILEEGKVLGIFTEQDALYWGLIRQMPRETPIEQLMTTRPTSINIEDNLTLAIYRMHEGKYRHLPVVDAEDKFLGVVSVRDVVSYLSEHYPYEILNLPPNPHQLSEAPEGA